MPTQSSKPLRGLAATKPERRREIASLGGKSSGGNFRFSSKRAAEAGRKGGKASWTSRREREAKQA